MGTEAAFHPLSEYMQFVDDYFAKLEMTYRRNNKVFGIYLKFWKNLINSYFKDPKTIKRSVYLATDEPNIWLKDIKFYEEKGYTFIGDSDIGI